VSSGYVLRSRGDGGCWNDRTYPIHCPHGKVGDQLWVRETFCNISYKEAPEESCILYRADGEMHPPELGWKSPIFMPRLFSRITLEITEIRVQRVQEISEMDAVAEGIDPFREGNATCRTAYQGLWDSINAKKYPWADNLWVWALTFRRIQP
jgi:hypothetical protein